MKRWKIGRNILGKALGANGLKAWQAIHAVSKLHYGKQQAKAAKHNVMRLITIVIPGKGMQKSEDVATLHSTILAVVSDLLYFCRRADGGRDGRVTARIGDPAPENPPSTPRNVPAATQLSSSLKLLHAHIRAVIHGKNNQEAMRCLDAAMAHFNNPHFLQRLLLGQDAAALTYRCKLAGALSSMLEAIGEDDAGEEKLTGGRCCMIAGCRFSAIYEGFCERHALERQRGLASKPTLQAFLGDPGKRRTFQSWLADYGDELGLASMQFLYDIEGYKRCCNASVKGNRSRVIFKKYIAKNAAKRIPCSVEGVERVRLEAESKGGIVSKASLEKLGQEVHHFLEIVFTRKFVQSRVFTDHFNDIREYLRTPRAGDITRYEWRLPGDGAARPIKADDDTGKAPSVSNWAPSSEGKRGIESMAEDGSVPRLALSQLPQAHYRGEHRNNNHK
eukprot:g4145.t1